MEICNFREKVRNRKVTEDKETERVSNIVEGHCCLTM